MLSEDVTSIGFFFLLLYRLSPYLYFLYFFEQFATYLMMFLVLLCWEISSDSLISLRYWSEDMQKRIYFSKLPCAMQARKKNWCIFGFILVRSNFDFAFKRFIHHLIYSPPSLGMRCYLHLSGPVNLTGNPFLGNCETFFNTSAVCLSWKQICQISYS